MTESNIDHDVTIVDVTENTQIKPNEQIIADIVKQLLSGSNPYVEGVLHKVISDKDKRGCCYVHPKYADIYSTLTTDIDKLKTQFQVDRSVSPALVINSILREKLFDRSDNKTNQTQKIIFIGISIVLPIITNLFQYFLTHQVTNNSG